MNTTERYKHIWHHLEQSLEGNISREKHGALQPSERGRGSRTKPRHFAHTQPMPKASRQGEVQMRNELLGTAVQRWFKQLRRLQSLRHAIRAANPSPTAQQYQIELWSSIKHATGFTGGFAHWWTHHRQAGLEHHPGALPCGIPSIEAIEGIFHSFKQCYETFESWHLRQRGKILQAKHDSTRASLHKDLKDPPREQVSILFRDFDIQISGFDLATGLGSLHPQPPTRGTLTWTSDSGPLRVQPAQDGLYRLSSSFSLESGHVIQCRQYLSTHEEIQHELLTFWSAKWNNRPQPTEEEWTRILGFFHAHLPQHCFEVQDISQHQWRKALKRFKSNAARGADGVSHLDLLHLPSTYTEALLKLLHQIELEQHPWPKALLVGLCLALAKVPQAHQTEQFRPIMIFSVLYRCWSSIRARSLITQFAPFTSDTEFGFLPGCETLQAWLLLQTQLEESILFSAPHVGFSTDLKKAFNMIPRDRLISLSSHLGIPERITQPWAAFLKNTLRYFQTGQFISHATTTSVGVPEGDSLSVFAMIQLDYAFTRYQKAFAPMSQTISYVDNLIVTAAQVDRLAQAWVSL